MSGSGQNKRVVQDSHGESSEESSCQDMGEKREKLAGGAVTEQWHSLQQQTYMHAL